MENLNRRLAGLAEAAYGGQKIRVAIVGLGSVGQYLLDYLSSWPCPNLEIIVAGRDPEKMERDVNIVRVANVIRFNHSKPVSFRRLDLEDIGGIADFFSEARPHFVVNSSRVYSGLKYGSISWPSIRAYGLWCPLSIKYIRNLMLGYQQAGSEALVINTSYSDAVIAWLKSAGLAYPDFGSGNLNHLIPRIKFAAAAQLGLERPEDLEVVLATSHFHDVVISKEGQDEGCPPLIHLSLGGRQVDIDLARLWRDCAIAMPTDAKRNMMNASSNFEIISKILTAIGERGQALLHVPGVDGEIGGYPVHLDFRPGQAGPPARFHEDYFDLGRMRVANRRSICLDGIEKVEEGALFYTDELLAKVRDKFGADLPKRVAFDEIDRVAGWIIEEIIKPGGPR